MIGETSHEPILLDNLPLIERVAASMGRRQGLRGDDLADFGSWVKLKLIENDLAALRKFRGESSFTTYVTVVIAMLARDYRVQRWGRWRPSAEARRQGDVAVRLETLVRRDGFRLAEAGELLRTSGATTMTDRELSLLMAKIPDRAPLRPVEVGAEPIASVEGAATAEELVLTSVSSEQRRRADQALEEILAELVPEDRLILRMHFWEGLAISDVARGLALDQKPLYRRVERLLGQLRRRLVERGIDLRTVQELLANAEASA